MFAPRSPRLVLAALVLAAVAPLAAAQTLDDVVPIVGEPGDLVILRGTGLGATTSVEFSAGSAFIPWWTIGVAPIAVSATEVHAIVPAFLPKLISPIGLSGSIRVMPAGLVSAFFLLESTGGAVTTIGTGTTQASGMGKPVTSLGWDLSITGLTPWLPKPPGFFLSLENVTPSSLVVATVSLPGAPPYPLVGDGQVVVDLSRIVLLGAGAIGNHDEAMIFVGIPPSATGTFVFQWGLLEAGSGTLAVSSGMQVVLP